MTYDITDTLSGIDFAPADEYKEIIQNVKCIISTYKKTVPLYREFGVDASFVDKPVIVAKAMYASEIVDAVQKYEPRAAVESIEWEGELDGILKPKVRISINEDAD